MSIGGINGSDIRSLGDRFQRFMTGQSTLQKQDLTEVKGRLDSAGNPAADDVGSLLQQFDSIDTNDDGISRQELDAFSNGRAAENARTEPPSRSITINISPVFLGGGQPAATGGGQTGPSAQGSSPMSGLESFLKSLDANGDGQISLEELMNALKGSGDDAAGESGASGAPDLTKLLEKAFAAADKLKNGEEAPAVTGESGKTGSAGPRPDDAEARPPAPGARKHEASIAAGIGEANKNIEKYTSFSSASFSIRESSLTVRYA